MGTDGKRYGAYRMVMQRTNAIGRVLRLQGTTWKDPPILDSPSETRKIGGRTVRARTTTATGCAWWPGARRRPSYWVSNTLLQTLDEEADDGHRPLDSRAAARLASRPA